MQNHKIVSQEEWLAARKAHLAKEKEFTRQRDRLSAARRELPWVRVEKDYVFQDTDGPVSLSELFGSCSQLIVYHFMFHPDWDEPCKSCSFISDSFNGTDAHLKARDIAFAAVSRAPVDRLRAFAKRMGWSFRWVSSQNTDFNRDYHVSFTPEEIESGEAYYNFEPNGFPMEEAPGISVFAKDAAGDVFHTYSSYGRGLDLLIGTYNFIDLVPKGRDEADLPWTMAWIDYHDRYDDA